MRSSKLVGAIVAFALALTTAITLESSAHAQAAVDPDEPLPAGHPTGNAAPNAQHAGAGSGNGGGNPNVFEPPPDTTEEDGTLPSGTIAITILDADNKPIPNTNVTLGILHNTVAKGESREHKNGTTNAVGAVTFDKLTPGSGIAYRVSVAQDGATFAASPFQLPLARGINVGLHVYPVTRDLNQALIVMQAILYAEMKDDRVQIQQVLTVYNFGRTAWLPNEIMVGLPTDFTALNGVQEMSDTGIDPVPGKGARLHGTFAPGRHDVEFRWQLPYSDHDKDIAIAETLPPHIAVARVIAASAPGMRLVVEGFPEAESHTDPQGQRVLVTEKQMRRDEPQLATLHVELRDLPVAGPWKIIATMISSVGVFIGLGLAFVQRRGPASAKSEKRAKSEGKAERADLLADLEDLERAHSAGEIGPKTYERARREIIDALARSLATSAAATAKSASPTPAA